MHIQINHAHQFEWIVPNPQSCCDSIIYINEDTMKRPLEEDTLKSNPETLGEDKTLSCFSPLALCSLTLDC